MPYITVAREPGCVRHPDYCFATGYYRWKWLAQLIAVLDQVAYGRDSYEIRYVESIEDVKR